MDNPRFLYLRRILPEIDLSNQVNKNILLTPRDDDWKLQKILINHFKSKTTKVIMPSIEKMLQREAKTIHKIFPTLAFEYISNLVQMFKDMPNRKEIILRTIAVQRKTSLNSGTAKRSAIEVQLLDNINNNQPATKILKLEIPNRTYDLKIPSTRDLSSTDNSNTAGVNSIPASSGIYSEMQPKVNQNNCNLLKPHTVTSSSYNGGVMKTDEITMSEQPPSTCTSTCINSYDYQVPDIMDHFDLPVFSITQNCTVTSTNNDANIDFLGPLPVGNVCTVETTDEPVNLIKTKEIPCQEDILCSVIQMAPKGLKQEDTNNSAQLMPKVKMEPNEVKQENTSYSEQLLTDVKLESKLVKQENFDNNPQLIHEMKIKPKIERDSQDSNKTEIYSPDMNILPENGDTPEINEHFSTYIRSNMSVENLNRSYGYESPTYQEIHQEIVNLDSGLQNSVKIRKDIFEEFPETINSAPKSLKHEENPVVLDSVEMLPMCTQLVVKDEFNLIDYIREITNASPKTIQKYCNRLDLPLNKKPSETFLSVLIDNILTVNVESDESDVESINFVNSVQTWPDDEASQEPSENNSSSNDQNEPNPQNLKIEPDVAIKKENPDDSKLDIQLVNNLCSIFPEACPNYIRGLCRGKVMNDAVMDDLITVILSANNAYPKRPKPEPEPEVLPENQLEILKEFLPDADPDYLRMMCDQCEGKPDKLKQFLNDATEKRNYPTLKDYQRRQQLSAQQKQYTIDFNVENFIKLIPDPHAFFSDPARKIKLSAADSHYVLVFLRNKFNKLPIRTIQSTFQKNACRIRKTMKDLTYLTNQSSFVMKSVRRAIDLPKGIENIPLLQELAYYTHEIEINQHLKEKKEFEEAERLEAKNKGLLKTCSCCYDEEVLVRDIYTCEKNCEFCRSCIVKSSEVRFGEGKLDFPCLMDCDSSFSLQTLQSVLCPKLFSKIAQKKALEEIKAAGIEELEMCPFCDFATIPAEGYNIFTCMNPECMKESCRMCKEPSHIPLRCDEIEKDEDVRARVFVENKMTEALLRKCWKCGVKFFKEEGCNKMTCSCGAQMCYVCGKPVKDYKHFNGNGGDRYDLCPLYSDTNVLNKENVLRGAEQAKAEIGNVNLKHDPTADVNKHFQERRKMFPQDHLLDRQHAPRGRVHARQRIPIPHHILGLDARHHRPMMDILGMLDQLIEQRRMN